MKLEIKNKIATLTATNSTETRRLIDVYLAQEEGVKTLAYVPRGNKYAKRPYRNAWKGKHCATCTSCSGQYKNMKLHVMKKHPGHATSTQSAGFEYPKAL